MAENEISTKESRCEDTIENASSLALDALTLILAAGDLNERGPCLEDVGACTDRQSRVTSLLLMASDKTAQAIKAMSAAVQEVAHG